MTLQNTSDFLPNFREGNLYVRRDLHDKYGGQRQGGISTPRNLPAIFIFSGHSGRDYGYGFDGWQDVETFHYTGEGQPDNGNMKFLRGNKAIRDHQQDGKSVFLFESFPRNDHRRGSVRFIAELELQDYEIRERDSSGIHRKVIVFVFRRVPN